MKEKVGVDPQNLTWRNDSEGFGYRMLSMMGWSEGKGLGANENGTTEFVRAKKRSDNLGLGADVNTSNNWLANTTAFDGILSRLNASAAAKGNTTTTTTTTTSSATTTKGTTKVTNRRYRFHKLVKAKTLANHSAEDISAILAPQQEEQQDDGFDGGDLKPTVGHKRKHVEGNTKPNKKVDIGDHSTSSKDTNAGSESSDTSSNSDSSSCSSSDSDSDSLRLHNLRLRLWLWIRIKHRRVKLRRFKFR